MQRATKLTVIRHDDSTEQYADVRYTLTAAGLHILTADGEQLHIGAHDMLTTHATVTAGGRDEI